MYNVPPEGNKKWRKRRISTSDKQIRISAAVISGERQNGIGETDRDRIGGSFTCAFGQTVVPSERSADEIEILHSINEISDAYVARNPEPFERLFLENYVSIRGGRSSTLAISL